MGTAETRFGTKVRAAIERLDITMSDAAHRCKVERSAISDAINDRTVSARDGINIAIGLGISVEHERITPAMLEKFYKSVTVTHFGTIDGLDEALREVWQAGFDCATKLADDSLKCNQWHDGARRTVAEHLRRNGAQPVKATDEEVEAAAARMWTISGSFHEFYNRKVADFAGLSPAKRGYYIRMAREALR